MELAQLEYFRTVAKYEHITNAAEKIHISQPALSRAISRLEDEVGVPLFDREPNRIRLNSNGKILLHRIEHALGELEAGIKEVNSMNDDECGDISFAVTTSGFLSPLIRNYLLQHPKVHMRQYTMDAQQMKEALESRKIDFGISLVPIISEFIDWRPQLEEELIILVSENHRLAGRREVDLKELEGERFIFHNASFGVREIICEQCLRNGFIPDIYYEGNEDEILVPLVERNLGILWVPAISMLWRHTEAGEPPPHPLRPIHISKTVARRTLGFCSVRGHYVSGAAKAFLQYLQDNISNYVKLSQQYFHED